MFKNEKNSEAGPFILGAGRAGQGRGVWGVKRLPKVPFSHRKLHPQALQQRAAKSISLNFHCLLWKLVVIIIVPEMLVAGKIKLDH